MCVSEFMGTWWPFVQCCDHSGCTTKPTSLMHWSNALIRLPWLWEVQWLKNLNNRWLYFLLLDCITCRGLAEVLGQPENAADDHASAAASEADAHEAANHAPNQAAAAPAPAQDRPEQAAGPTQIVVQ